LHILLVQHTFLVSVIEQHEACDTIWLFPCIPVLLLEVTVQEQHLPEHEFT